MKNGSWDGFVRVMRHFCPPYPWYDGDPSAARGDVQTHPEQLAGKTILLPPKKFLDSSSPGSILSLYPHNIFTDLSEFPPLYIPCQKEMSVLRKKRSFS